MRRLARRVWVFLGFPQRRWAKHSRVALARHEFKTLRALELERSASDWYRPDRRPRWWQR